MPALPLAAVFDDLPDPRRDTANKLHALTDVLTIATCAVIGGAESWEAIAEYGRTKEDFFRRFLELENGIPSPDTFERVFAKLAPGAFAQAFGRWMAAACEATGLVPVAIDGKSARSARQNTATGCLTVVSAWATENRLTLGQVAVEDGSNEVAAIPELLKVLDLSGAVVTIDAAGCQVANAGRSGGRAGTTCWPPRGTSRPCTRPSGPCSSGPTRPGSGASGSTTTRPPGAGTGGTRSGRCRSSTTRRGCHPSGRTWRPWCRSCGSGPWAARSPPPPTTT